MKPLWLRIDGAPGVEAVLDAADVDRRADVAFADVGNVAVAALRGQGAVWLWLLDGDEALADEVAKELGEAGLTASRADAPIVAPGQVVRVGEWKGVDRAAVEQASARDGLLIGFVALAAIAATIGAFAFFVWAFAPGERFLVGLALGPPLFFYGRRRGDEPSIVPSVLEMLGGVATLAGLVQAAFWMAE